MKKTPITTTIFSDYERRKNSYINYLTDRNKIEMEKKHQLKMEFSDKYLYKKQSSNHNEIIYIKNPEFYKS